MSSNPSAERLINALGDVFRAMRASNQRWERLGLPVSRSDLVVLRYLEAKGEQRIGDVAEKMCVSPSVTSRQVAALEQHGFVSRRPDPADARAGLVSLTDRGRAQLTEVSEIYVQHLGRVVSRWTDDDSAAAAAILEQLAEAIIADLDDLAVPA